MNVFLLIIPISLLFSCLGQVAADLYIPSLPAISEGLSASITQTQLSISSYMIGYTLSFLVYGPLSDAIGRKKPLILGMMLFFLGSAGATFTSSIELLIVCRLLQGLGAGAGTILGPAILRDIIESRALAKTLSHLGMITATAVACAPFIGGYLQQSFGWRANFIFLVFYSLLSLTVALFILPETNKHRTKKNLKPKRIKENLLALFANKKYVTYITTISFLYGSIVVWITLGPILLQKHMGLSPSSFGFIAFLAGMSYTAGAFVNSRLVSFFNADSLIKAGATLCLLSGFAILFPALLKLSSPITIAVPVCIVIFSAGIIFPNALSEALIPFKKIAGIAGAIAGSSQILGGTIASLIVSFLPDNTALPLAIAFIVSGSAILRCQTSTTYNLSDT